MAGLPGFVYPALRAEIMRKGGLEPPRLATQEPKSCASTNSATPAWWAEDNESLRKTCASFCNPCP